MLTITNNCLNSGSDNEGYLDAVFVGIINAISGLTPIVLMLPIFEKVINLKLLWKIKLDKDPDNEIIRRLMELHAQLPFFPSAEDLNNVTEDEKSNYMNKFYFWNKEISVKYYHFILIIFNVASLSFQVYMLIIGNFANYLNDSYNLNGARSTIDPVIYAVLVIPTITCINFGIYRTFSVIIPRDAGINKYGTIYKVTGLFSYLLNVIFLLYNYKVWPGIGWLMAGSACVSLGILCYICLFYCLFLIFEKIIILTLRCAGVVEPEQDMDVNLILKIFWFIISFSIFMFLACLVAIKLLKKPREGVGSLCFENFISPTIMFYIGAAASAITVLQPYIKKLFQPDA